MLTFSRRMVRVGGGFTAKLKTRTVSHVVYFTKLENLDLKFSGMVKKKKQQTKTLK